MNGAGRGAAEGELIIGMFAHTTRKLFIIRIRVLRIRGHVHGRRTACRAQDQSSQSFKTFTRSAAFLGENAGTAYPPRLGIAKRTQVVRATMVPTGLPGSGLRFGYRVCKLRGTRRYTHIYGIRSIFVYYTFRYGFFVWFFFCNLYRIDCSQLIPNAYAFTNGFEEFFDLIFD